MGEINWNLGNPEGGSFIDSFNRGIATRNALDAQRLAQGRAEEAAQLQRQGRARVLAALASGRELDAAAAAYAYGDNETGSGLRQVADTRLEQGQAGNTGFGNIVGAIGALPYEQRRAAISAARPRLVALGIPQAEIDAFDPTDDNIRALASVDYSMKDATAQRIDQQGADRQDRESRRTTVDGALLVQNPETGEWAPVYRAPDVTLNEYGEVVIPGIGGDAGTAQTQGAGGGGATGFDAVYDSFVRPTEGGYTPRDDRHGSAANFGINERAHRGHNHGGGNVRNITPDEARRIYREEYWGPSGADRLSGPIQAIHFDTAVNMGVGTANDMLRRSGGDPNRYMALREARHRSLGGEFQGAWATRNRRLRSFAAGQGGQPQERPAEFSRAGAELADASNLVGEEEQGGSYSNTPQITRRSGGGDSYRYLSPEEARGAGYADGTVVQRGPRGDQVRQNPPRAANNRNAGRDRMVHESYRRAISTAQRLLQHPGMGAAVGLPNPLRGGFGPLGNLPGSPAYNFSAEVETFKSQVFIPMVQALVGMGALSNVEGQRLTDSVGSLDTNQSEEQFRSTLNRAIVDLSQSVPLQVSTVGEARALPPGTVFVGPDGRRRRR